MNEVNLGEIEKINKALGTEMVRVIGDRITQNCLECVNSEPKSVQELSQELNLSEQAVERRISMLAELDLIRQKTIVGGEPKFEADLNGNWGWTDN